MLESTRGETFENVHPTEPNPARRSTTYSPVTVQGLNNLPTYLPSYLLTYLPTYLPTYLLTYLTTYLPTYPPT